MDRQRELSELISRHFGTDDPLPVGWAELRAELEAVFEERDRLRRSVGEFEARAAESEKNEARLLDAIHVARIGYFEHDHLTGSIYWSPELLELWNCDPEVPPQLPEVVNILHPDDR
ncbi:MAG: hypothetical protein KDA27_13315, partial [Candidatus Eisenbacteria bacterium]|nr:hypothetical protein [Candidatus Eisenbacteria bacterium]